MTTRSLLSLVVISGSCAALTSCTSSEPAKPAAASAPVAMCVSDPSGEDACSAVAPTPAITFFPIAPAAPAATPAPTATPAPAAAAAPALAPAPVPTLLQGGFGLGVPARSGFNQAMGDIGQTDSNLREIEKAGWVATRTFADPARETGKLIDLFRKLEQGDKAKSKPAEFAALLKKCGDHATSLRDMLAAGNVDAKKASALLATIGTTCGECHTKYAH